MIAAWLGVKKQPHRWPARPEEMLAQLGPVPGLGHGGDVHAGLSAVVLDFNELKARHGR